MNRPKYCIANWKMNYSIIEAKEYFNKWERKELNKKNIKTIICPSFTELFFINKKFSNLDFQIGAQNVSHKEVGSYTGEISCDMIKNVGCEWVILGHSERRIKLNENYDLINKKMDLIITNKLHPILCIGESEKERNRCFF